MDPHLLTLAEWRALLHDPGERERRRGDWLLGTIAEVLQIAEECKKGGSFVGSGFHAGWNALREQPDGLLEEGTLLLLGLDKAGLVDALFEWDRELGDEGVTPWPPAADPHVAPWHTLRRLILRSQQSWLDPQVYVAMERLFGEDSGRHG